MKKETGIPIRNLNNKGNFLKGGFLTICIAICGIDQQFLPSPQKEWHNQCNQFTNQFTLYEVEDDVVGRMRKLFK